MDAAIVHMQYACTYVCNGVSPDIVSSVQRVL